MLLHEIIHILALSPALYSKFPQYQTKKAVKKINRKTVNGNIQVNALVTTKLLETAKTHFGCSSLEGVFLENEGTQASAGAHWEKDIFGNELMTSQKSGISSLSVLTLALLEDTSWYKVNYSLSENYQWGKGKGCSFFDSCN